MTDTTQILPKLRFPEFENDGEWKVVRLGEIAHFFKGKGISKAEVSDTGTTPCIRYGELYTYYKEIVRDVKSYMDISTDNLVLSKANDVIIPSSGETKEDISTASCIIEDGIALGGDINIIRSSANGIFLSYYLNNAKKNDIAKIAQGISIIHLYNEQLQNLSIALPSLPEQQKIASFLTSLDELISAHTQKLEALKSHKKGLMQQLFPANGEKTPKLRFPEFKNDGEWEEVRLGEIGTLKNGYAFKSDSYKESGVYKIITISNVKNGYLDLSKYNTIDKIPSDISDHQILNIEDILISMTGNVGRVCMVSETDCLLNQRVGIFQVYEGINKYFIFSILNSPSFENAMILAAQGAAQPNIGKFDIEKFSLLMPPTTFEQQRIASFLTSIDEMIQAQDDKIRKLKTYKNGLMQQMFPQNK